jgi:hypothetical protein
MGLLTARAVCRVGAAILVLALSVTAYSSALREAELKAALLYNFASFSQWPAEQGSGTFVIGVVGDKDLVKALRAVEGQIIDGRPIEIRALDETDDPESVQVLFLSGISERSMAAILARTLNAPVLTVGVHERFTSLGGIIRLFEDHGHLRFEVDAARAAAAHIKISSRVLNLARIVGNTELRNTEPSR